MRNIPAPRARNAIAEWFSWTEFPRLMLSAPRLRRMPTASGERIVVVMPGFGAGDMSTLPLRQFLQSLGYKVSGWNRGTNDGEVPELIDHMVEFVQSEINRPSKWSRIDYA